MNYIDYAKAVQTARGKFGPQATLICRVSAENFERIHTGGRHLDRYMSQPGSRDPELPYQENNIIFKIWDRPGMAFSVLDDTGPYVSE